MKEEEYKIGDTVSFTKGVSSYFCGFESIGSYLHYEGVIKQRLNNDYYMLENVICLDSNINKYTNEMKVSSKEITGKSLTTKLWGEIIEELEALLGSGYKVQIEYDEVLKQYTIEGNRNGEIYKTKL